MSTTPLTTRLRMKQEGSQWIRDLSWEAVYGQFIPAMYSRSSNYEALGWFFIGEVPTETGFTIGDTLRRGAWVDRQQRELVVLLTGLVTLEKFDSDEVLEKRIRELRGRVTEPLIRCRKCNSEVPAKLVFDCPNCRTRLRAL